jgi:dienelactone hydrolase
VARVRVFLGVEFPAAPGKIALMKSGFSGLQVLCLIALISFSPNFLMAQTNQTDAARWLANAQIAPPFTVPKSKSAWEKKRKEMRAQLWELLGKLPPRPKAPKIETLSRQDRGDNFIEKFQFDNGAGSTVPGYVLSPKRLSAKAPAILYCHWHGGQYEIGKEELFQARHTPEPPGPALVKRGFVVLAIDAYCFGERNGRGPGGPAELGKDAELTASKFNLWVGRTLWGMILRDDLMALDYLASRPEVDASRIGAMGMSMGATRCWWLMALDERIRTGVPICCLTRYQNLIEHELLKAHGIYYFVPNFLNHFDTEAVIVLIAPRPVLFLDGDQDGTSPVDGIHLIEAAVRPVYHLYGKQDEFQSIVYPGQGHVYTPEMWAKTLAWMEEKLGGR